MTDTPQFPSSEDTQTAVDKIAPGRREEAAVALEELSRRIIAVVREVDLTYNVADYLRSVTLTVEGPGSFRLQIADRNTEAADAVVEALMDEMAGNQYHKPLRPIVIEQGAQHDE